MSSTGASRPMLAASGRNATRKDGKAMAMTEPMSACFRPYRSPIQPNSAEPNRMPTRLALNTGPSAAGETPHARTRCGAANAIAAMS